MKNKISLHLLTIRILFAINILVVAGLWITGFLSGLNPEKWGWFSLIGYVFPFFIVATIIFFIPWLFIRKRCMLISFIGLIVAYYPVSLYCPLNFQSDKSSDTIKLMSYNVLNWGAGIGFLEIVNSMESEFSNEEKYHIMIDYFKSVNADIVAVQEGQLMDGVDSLKNIYHYNDTVNSLGEQRLAVLLLSKYPITHKENLNLISQGNGAGAFWINVKGHEIIVIAAHLQTMGFSIDERENFSTMVHGNDDNSDSIKSTSKTILGKILIASKKRAAQADLIAKFIEKHHSTPIIVMGDFNDIPQSYTHARISDQLIDCYQKKGFGPGYSFRHFGIRERIDNILCSDDFEPLSCKVDDNIGLSDHQPIIATVRIK